MKSVSKMKKSIFVLSVIFLTATTDSSAQTWDGTSIPTRTAYTAQIGDNTIYAPYISGAKLPTLYIKSFHESDETQQNNQASIYLTNFQDLSAPNSANIVEMNIANASGGAVVDKPFVITGKGKVLMGINDPTTNISGDFKLYVAGGILTERVKVELQSNWPDYVFGENYSLSSLNEVENYITQNKHLPDVPSAAEVSNDGIDLGEMDAKLLRKIEELTLYLIELKKDNENLHSRIEQLEK